MADLDLETHDYDSFHNHIPQKAIYIFAASICYWAINYMLREVKTEIKLQLNDNYARMIDINTNYA